MIRFRVGKELFSIWRISFLTFFRKCVINGTRIFSLRCLLSSLSPRISNIKQLFLASSAESTERVLLFICRNVRVENVTEPYGLSEGPHWDHRTQTLYFVDIYNQYIRRLDPATGNVKSVYIGKNIYFSLF